MLNAKIHAPSISKNVISRGTLLAKLQHALDYRLTSVIAPAGYGKTTLVLDWLRTCDARAAWLSLDETDNNPVSFWRNFVSAIEEAAGEACRETDYVFAAPELMRADIHINVILDRLFKESANFVLVLDDLHLITEPSIMSGLSYLLDYLPKQAHIIVISREEPALKLSKLRLKERALCIDQRDLRFNGMDIERFYQAKGYALKDTEIQEVEAYTEGWAAAMVAVAMSFESGQESDHIALLTHASRDIGQYIKEDIISTWPPERLNFAVKTAILDTLSEDLCAAVTGHQNCRLLLKEIYETSGFLTDLDGQRQSYRYHNLFKEMLSELLSDSAPGEIRLLHERAGRWFKDRHMIPEAIDQYLSGGLFREALELIEHQIDYLIDKSDFGRVLPWLSRLPEGHRDGSFKIAAIHAIYYSEAGYYELARQWIAKMNVLKDDSRYAAIPDWQGYSRTVCALTEANILVREGNIEFLSLVSAAAEISCGKYYKMPAYCDFNLADIYFHRCPISKLTGLFRKAPEAYAAMAEKYRGMISINPGYAPLGIGAHLYESNELEKALPFLLKAVEEAREANCPGALVPAMVDIARLKRASGDMAGAFTVLDECEKLLQGVGRAHWIYAIRAFRCRLYIDTGCSDKVLAWFSASKLNIFTELNRIREFELITYARVLISLNRAQDAELLLQRLLSFTTESRKLHSRVEVLNLLALLAYENHQMRRAYNYLEESLDIGIREGYVRSYLDELSPMARFLRSYIQSRGRREEEHSAERLSYTAGLLKQMPGSLLQTLKARNVVADDVSEKILSQLTEREKKVMELLVNAATNKEIGEKLGISLRTVKTHTGNIYGKLGLKNRAQCVKLVRELGLL